MKRLIILFILTLPPAALSFSQSVSSPDGNYTFTFSRSGGRMLYAVSYRKAEIILPSEMGVDIDNGLFESALGIPRDSQRLWTSNMTLMSVDTLSQDTLWHPLYGENSVIRDRYRQMTLRFVKGGGEESDGESYDKRRQYFFNIEIRAYNEGVAFRYVFPESGNGLFLNIVGERTRFRLPEGTMAYYEEWAQAPYHYTALKRERSRTCSNSAEAQPVFAESDYWKGESERPLLLKTDSFYIALLEARLTDYARGKFALEGENTLRLSMYDGVEVIPPYSTPWRVIMAGVKASDLINNKEIVLNLNDPCMIADIDFILPGKAYRCGRLERSFIMRGIQFAKEMDLKYIELDAGWYGPEMKMASSALREASNRNFTIAEVCDSARAAGLGVWLYVNQRALYRQLDSILPLYKQWGVSGIKFGFVQIGNQMWTTWLHQAVRKCADYGIMVDIHDEYRPTGVSRALPNLLTQEGVCGNEEMPDADHNTILPFTRFLAGPADYTLCYYNSRVKNTKAHQLALAAVYYSPLQFMFWYDDPKVYDGGEELEFWRRIPTTYDYSIALDGTPGEYVVQARRKGDTWFVGIIGGTKARTVNIDTSFLPKGKYKATLFTDDASLKTRSKVATTHVTLKSGKIISLDLLPSGGAAIIIEK